MVGVLLTSGVVPGNLEAVARYQSYTPPVMLRLNYTYIQRFDRFKHHPHFIRECSFVRG